MPRAIVNPKTLDALIRAKVAALAGCSAIEPLPVTLKDNHHRDAGCNWTIPGWVGDADLVRSCLDEIGHYLRFLQDQFDIPAHGAGE